MRKPAVVVLLILLSLAFTLHAQDADPLDRARAILKQSPIIDSHIDTPYQIRERKKTLADVDLRDTRAMEPAMHTDMARLKKGGVGGVFWSVYVDQKGNPGDRAVTATLEQLDMFRRMVAAYPDSLEIASTADDIVRIQGKGKIASMAGVEGGHSIGNSIGALRMLYALGARYMTLTHSLTNDFADSATDAPRHDGLTRFGVEVVREMNRLGMLVDLSHVSEATMMDVLAETQAPVIFSHSTARALNTHPRNVPDSVLRLLPKNGGVIMVDFVPGFVDEKARDYYVDRDGMEKRFSSLYPGDPDRAKAEHDAWKAANPPPAVSVSAVADHVDHIRKVAGIDHIGIGSDFDGIFQTIDGLKSTEDYPNLFAELIGRGYTEADLKKISGQNILRVMRAAEAVAARTQKERPPSEARIETLDKR